MDVKVDQNDTASITTTSSSTPKNTPTHTAITDDFEGDTQSANAGGIETAPWAGETFVIRHRGSGRAIAVNENGDVRLTFFENVAMSQHCHWKCTERDGWFGFKHAGRYLGHNGRWDFHAEVKHHRSFEYFIARKHPDGGYQLLTLHGWIFRIMDVAEDGEKLKVVEMTDGKALWDFVKV